MGWQWHQLDNMQINGTFHQTDKHTSISPLNFTGHMLWCPTNSVNALKEIHPFVFEKKEDYAYVTVTSISPPNTRLVLVSKVN